MAAEHEINRLILEVENARGLPSRDRLFELVQVVLEEYFSQFDIIGVDTVFDRIELELGELDPENFETEFNVRLRLLLSQELKLFFDQNGIQAEIQSRSKLAIGELFDEYLRTGVNAQNDRSLSSVFSKLVSDDIVSLERILDSSESWPIIRQRLFDQIDFSSYESYWIKSKASTYLPIRRINQKILNDFSERAFLNYGFGGLQGVLKKFTYDFMFASDAMLAPIDAYIKLLQSQKSAFGNFAHRISISTEKYLQTLKGADVESREIEPFPSALNFAARRDRERILMTFLIEGRSPERIQINDIRNYLQEVQYNQLDEIAQRLVSGLSERVFLDGILRVHQVFSPVQLKFLYSALSAKLSGSNKKSVSLVSEFAALIDKAFGENVFSMSIQVYRGYYMQRRLGQSGSIQLVSEVSKYMSARKGKTPSEIVATVESRMQLFSGDTDNEIQKAIDGAKQALEEIDTMSHKNGQPNWSQLHVFIHFLETGLWILPTASPQETLSELLESEVSGIRSALSERVHDLVLWVRLIHQFSLDQVHVIFNSVFGLDPHYPSLTAALLIPQKAGEINVERALLEVFITTKARMLVDEQAMPLGNFHLEFARVLEPLTKKDVLSDRFEGVDFQHELSQWIHQPNQIPEAKDRRALLQRASKRIDVIHAWLNTPSVPMQTWRSVFSGLDKEVLIDLIDRLNQIVVIQELESFVDMISRAHFAKSLGEERLVYLLVGIAKGQGEALVSSAINDWKDFKTKNHSAAEKAETALKNSVQQKWLGSTTDDEALGAFLAQLERTLQSGQFRSSVEYESFQSFEGNLRRLVEIKEPRLLKYLEQTSGEKLIVFLSRLNHTTLSAMKITLDAKFKHTLFLDVVFSIHTDDLEERQIVDRVVLAYGLGSVQFHRVELFRFLNYHLPEVELPVIEGETDTQFDENIVLATIHYLKYGRLIDDRLTEANVELVLVWVLQFRRGVFLATIRRDASRKHILLSVFSAIKESKWGYAISLMLGVNQDRIETEIALIAKVSKDLTKVLADRVSIAINVSSTLVLSELETLRFEPYSFDKTEKRALAKIDQLESEQMEAVESELFSKLIRIGIRPEFEGDYDVFDLMRVVIDSGSLPSWTMLYRPKEIELVVFTLHQSIPIKSKRLLETLLRKKQGALNLLSLVGVESFINISRLIWNDSILTFETLVDSLVDIHETLGTEEILKSYFMEQLIRMNWPFNSSRLGRSARLILAGVPTTFGLSTDEYVKVLTLKSLDQSDELSSKVIAGYLESRIASAQMSFPGRAQRNLDLLKHLVVENEVPWWADHSKTLPQQIETHIKQFSLKLLNEDPNLWVADLLASGHALDVLSRLIEVANHQQFDRIVLAISPNMGGFVVSFNMLLTRLSFAISESQWRVFVLEYMLKVKDISAGHFVLDATARISQEFSINYKRLIQELQVESKEAVQSGELRFRPLVDLLDTSSDYEESALKFSEEKNETRSFDLVLRFYLIYGSIQIGTYPKPENYIDFVLELKRSFVQDDSKTRSIIREELKEGLVRSRIVRFESDHFIHALISILFPAASESIVSKGKSMQRFVADLIGVSNAKVIHDLFYSTIFEQSLSAYSELISANDLLLNFIKKANVRFELEAVEKEISLDIYDMNDSVKTFVIQSLFGSTSKLRLGSIESSSTPADQGEGFAKSSKVSERETLTGGSPESGQQVDKVGNDRAAKVREGDSKQTAKSKTKGIEHEEETLEDNYEEETELKSAGPEEERLAGVDDVPEQVMQFESPGNVDDAEQELEMDDVPDVELDFEVNLKNAGLVIVWPYLARYFEILEMLKDDKFKSKKAARRAVQLLQHLVTGSESAPEHELLLNKVLCGVKIATPIPFEIELTDQEREVSEQMLKGLLQNWPRLKNTSIEALREGFIVRDGRLIETDEVWQLKVEDKTLDILMDGMPWSFGIIKLPWMDKRLMVEWR